MVEILLQGLETCNILCFCFDLCVELFVFIVRSIRFIWQPGVNFASRSNDSNLI